MNNTDRLRRFHRAARLAAAGVGLALLTSPSLAAGDPLDEWSAADSGTTDTLVSVGFGQGLFVAVGQRGRIVTSPDARTWRVATVPTAADLNSVVWAGDHFVAVGAQGVIVRSAEGSAWTLEDSPTSLPLLRVGLAPWGLVAVGEQGTLLTQTGNGAWQAVATGTAQPFAGIASDGIRCVVAGGSNNDLATAGSTNGRDWQVSVARAGLPILYEMIYADGRFLGLSFRGQTLSSVDGVQWVPGNTGQGISGGRYKSGLVQARGTYVAVGGPYTAGRIIVTSTNGSAWVTRLSVTNTSPFYSVAYGLDQFVVVGAQGAILRSSPLIRLSLPARSGNAWPLALSAEPGARYRVQFSDSLAPADWQDWVTVTNRGEQMTVAEVGPAGAARFYRALRE